MHPRDSDKRTAGATQVEPRKADSHSHRGGPLRAGHERRRARATRLHRPQEALVHPRRSAPDEGGRVRPPLRRPRHGPAQLPHLRYGRRVEPQEPGSRASDGSRSEAIPVPTSISS